jgi:hypothetical protein
VDGSRRAERSREAAKKKKEENNGSEQENSFLRDLALWFPLPPMQLLGNAFNMLHLFRVLD